jgi:hypothetical protein
MLRKVLNSLVVVSVVFGACSASAFASGEAAGWRVSARAYPTNLPPGQLGDVNVDLLNVGAATNSGPVTVTDVLPEGITFTGSLATEQVEPWECSGAAVVTCTNTKPILPGRQRLIDLQVNVPAGTPPGFLPNRVTASGGGAFAPATSTDQLAVSATPAPFGLDSFESFATTTDGTPATQAGSHPYEMTTALRFDVSLRNGSERVPSGDAKVVEVALPAGVVVNPTATPTHCTEPQLAVVPGESSGGHSECPVSSQVGVVVVHLGSFLTHILQPVYNMVPPTGEPAELGFTVLGSTTVHILPTIRTASDSGISASVPGLGQVELIQSSLTLWDNPTEASHDGQRAECSDGGPQEQEPAPLCPTERSNKPFLTLPTSCAGPLNSTVQVNSWQEPLNFIDGSFTGESATESITGCERLSLHPSFTAAPDTAQADTPAGLTFDLKTPQDGLTHTEALAPPDLRTTTVTLPAGVAINPGQAAGLAEVDPHTAQLTVTTNPLPSIIGGVPTDLRTINAVIDREGFMFNPTNCSPQSFAGTATSSEGAQAPIASHFQVGSCQSLKFAPDFKVATQGRTSKADGASLEAKIVYPTTPAGNNQASSQANIASVKVDLPKQLPSRLTTLQKACLAKVFEANPAACPKESIVGHATAITPVLPVPLNGPAYFVSHGGEAFPSLIIVLQGYGVTVDLVGTTFISKAGITSSTFKQVPDVPISSFDLMLPEGKYSALAANLPASAKSSFCGQKLTMPTAFVGQNGAEIHESTAISVSGCAKAKALTRAQKLISALKACKKKAKGKRAGCEKTARKEYGAVKKAVHRKAGRS